MKSRSIFKLILISGLFPFIFPIVSGFYMVMTESWKIFDWLIMYSFVYWPTYVMGLIAVITSIFILNKTKT